MNNTARLLGALGMDMQDVVKICDTVARIRAEDAVLEFTQGKIPAEELEARLIEIERRDNERRLQLVQSFR